MRNKSPRPIPRCSDCGKTWRWCKCEKDTKALARIVKKVKEKASDKTVVWEPSNVYPSARLGKGVSVAKFAEVGKDCVVGDYTRIGKGAFICELVEIGKGCFIGPHVCFSNDKFPPSSKQHWKRTIVKDGARLGACVMVLPGVVIGRNALVGMGAVVTKDIPDGETWIGNPAHKLL